MGAWIGDRTTTSTSNECLEVCIDSKNEKNLLFY